jgi:hypothetical protein
MENIMKKIVFTGLAVLGAAGPCRLQHKRRQPAPGGIQ